MQKIFQLLIGIVTSLAAVAITLVVTFILIAQGRTQIVSTQGINVSNAGNHTIAYNATNQIGTAIAILPAWLGIFVIAMLGSVLLGLVYLYLKGRH